MKVVLKIFFIVLISILACKQTSGDLQAVSLKGTWISLKYKKVGIETKSPSKAFSETFDETPSCLLFDDNVKTPFRFGSLFDPNVGGGTNTVFKYSSTDSSYYVGSTSHIDYRLKIKVINQDTILVMTGNPKLNHEKVFVKISNRIQKDPYLFFFRNYVLAGKYSVFDPSGVNQFQDVNFDGDGALKNFGDFQKYGFDFNSEYNLDILSFRDRNDQDFEFTTEFNEDTLNLFEVIFRQDSLVKGSRRYTLIKK